MEYGYEGPSNLMVVNMIDGQTQDIKNIYSDGDWSISPDDQHVAVYGQTGGVNSKQGLFIMTTDSNGKNAVIFDELAYYPFSWSSDGNTLYYWTAPIQGKPTQLRAYYLAEDRYVTLIDRIILTEIFGVPFYWKFSVSADESHILFWDPDLWIVVFDHE